MARVKKNIITEGLAGNLYKQIVFRQRGGKTFASTYPDMPEQKSKAQQQQISKFREAALFAKKAIQDPEQKAYYTALAKAGQSAYNAAVSDYLHQIKIKQQAENQPA
ncbi:hypothetical protein [Catalinimonas niigatensis]|uniref:hypothetical protein n=1 Tax=Catalinimonas niigatensis TaxID=1397264 RepID=UPI002665A200|nr:hypothetical protein [Catalinimonas niigatensis]WPP50205.1 hypothetical protein PZB72_26425 [Catalinimonas niigatensis]